MRYLLFFLLLCSTAEAMAGWSDLIDMFTSSNTDDPQTQLFSNAEIESALKQALVKGSEQAVEMLGKTNGFFSHPQLKIPMPEKLQLIESSLRKLKQDKLADDFVLSLNRAAEQAVPAARSILVNIIQSMSVEDAYQILNGGDTAATDFLRQRGGSQLQQQFQPIVKQATDSVGVTQKYKSLIDQLGMMSGLIDTSSLDIDRYVTEKATEGLFSIVEKEERLIRQNPADRTTELMRRVFSSL